MPCAEVKTAKYQTRKSPPFHAGHCPGQTKKGKDGDYVSKEDARGVYKWIKASQTKKAPKGSKSYLTHDNGARPYKVQVSGKSVEIYRGKYRRSLENTKAIDYDHMDHDELIKKLTVKEVHVGTSPCIPNADWCGAPTKGNTMLLHVSGKKYIHVGHGIFEFNMEDDFDSYYSMVGNNDVPYPITLGTKYVYFMLDNAMMPREAFKAKMSAAEWADGYTYLYGRKDFETGEPVVCDKGGPKIRNKCIQERREKVEEITKKYEKKFKIKVIADLHSMKPGACSSPPCRG
jgi:hypothetical protein